VELLLEHVYLGILFNHDPISFDIAAVKTFSVSMGVLVSIGIPIAAPVVPLIAVVVPVISGIIIPMPPAVAAVVPFAPA
jgi:hypothetical protein